MSTEQRDQQPTETPAPEGSDEKNASRGRSEFVKKAALAAITGAASGLAREALKAIGADIFGDDL
ncbi:hypothetical protein [Streptomyces collinus]|uniref:hypothetical protein n=1 Tax=Streptomyces collinus TaxID=42684 RepID=UPI00340623CF